MKAAFDSVDKLAMWRLYEELVSRSIYSIGISKKKVCITVPRLVSQLAQRSLVAVLWPMVSDRAAFLFQLCFTEQLIGIMERVASTVGFSLGRDQFTALDYADDATHLAHATNDLHST